MPKDTNENQICAYFMRHGTIEGESGFSSTLHVTTANLARGFPRAQRYNVHSLNADALHLHACHAAALKGGAP